MRFPEDERARRRLRRWLAPLALLATGAWIWRAPMPGVPVLTDLGTLGGRLTVAVAVNDHGQVAGGAWTANKAWHAFLWEKGRMRDLGTLGGTESAAGDINNRGQVVGRAETASGEGHAFLWENGRMRDLGILPGGHSSEGVAINERGQVVGTAWDRAGRRCALLWDGRRMVDLNRLVSGAGGRKLGTARDINNRGAIVGEAEELGPNGSVVWCGPYLLERGNVRVIGKGARRDREAMAINDAGAVLVRSDPDYVWEHGRGIRLLAARYNVYRINDEGAVVGHLARFHDQEAVLFRDGKQTNLARLRRRGPRMRLGAAFAINNRGQIVGCGGTPAGVRAFLLSGAP